MVEQLRALEDARKDGAIELPDGERSASPTSQGVLAEAKLTKGDLLRYYATVAPLLLPAVADRPLVMKRFPNGVDGPAFYQQRSREKPPPACVSRSSSRRLEPISEPDTRRFDRRLADHAALHDADCRDLAGPVVLARAVAARADYVALDLDPDDDAPFARVLDVARWIRDELHSLKVPAVPKTSGSSGLHIYIPLPPGTSYESGMLFCQIVATVVASRIRRPRQSSAR